MRYQASRQPLQDQLKGHRAKRPELNIEIKAHPLLLLMKEKSLVVWSLGLQLLAHLFQVPPLLAVFFLEVIGYLIVMLVETSSYTTRGLR